MRRHRLASSCPHRENLQEVKMADMPTQKQLLDELDNASRFLEDILNGKTTISKAAKIPGQDLDDFFTKAQLALQLEDYPKAEEMFTTLLILNNKDTRAALGLAGALEGQGKYETAMPVYFMVMATTLYDPVAPFRAGICLMHLGKKEEAITLFKLASECKDEIKSPKKLVYVEKAKGMLTALAGK